MSRLFFGGRCRARLHVVSENVAFAVTPTGLLEAVRIGVALPKDETRAMLGHEDRVLGAQRFGGLHPLISVELLRIENVGVQVAARLPIVTVAAAAVGEHGNVKVKEHAELVVLPLGLLGVWLDNDAGFRGEGSELCDE